MRSSHRHVNLFKTVSWRSECFVNSFISSVFNEWNKLGPDIRSSISYNSFRNALLKLIRPKKDRQY